MTNQPSTSRPPVIVVMGHIDHGKSTLLDYIRSANTVDQEAGGITQHVSAYEAKYKTLEGETKKITFIDTPGHAAFCAIRERGTKVADLAILVVSAEDGVKPQTLEAFGCIKEVNLPYVVAINKTDKPNANVEKVKADLAEHEIFLEGYGGDVPFAPVSAITGDGVSDLIELCLLATDLEELTGDPSKAAEGIIVESHPDPKRGNSATVIIKDGTLKKGSIVVAGESMTPVRILEDTSGNTILGSATFSEPVVLIGWNNLPTVGESFSTHKNKKEAEKAISQMADTKSNNNPAKNNHGIAKDGEVVIPLILEADAAGSLDALIHEINKMEVPEDVLVRLIHSGVGNISQNDIRLASAHDNSIVVGFNTVTDNHAVTLADQLGITIKEFSIIYDLMEYLEGIVKSKKPMKEVETTTGAIKILKIFSKTKDKQVIGGEVESGIISNGQKVKIIRNKNEIGTGVIKELQQLKKKVKEVKEGTETGMMVDSKTEIAERDRLEAYKTILQ